MPRDIFQAVEWFREGRLSRERLGDLHYHFIKTGVTRDRVSSLIRVSDALVEKKA